MFMKAGGADLLKTGTASREVRVGITQVSVGMMRVGVGMMWVGVGITLGRVVITWSGFRVGTKQCRDNTGQFCTEKYYICVYGMHTQGHV